MGEDDKIDIGSIAVVHGILPPDALRECREDLRLMHARGLKLSLAEILVSKGLLDREDIVKVQKLKSALGGEKKKIGPFELLAKLGEGGMGAVYKVRDARTGQVAALKILPANLAANKEFVQRFKGEARILKSLSHPNIVRALDFGQLDYARRQLHYMSMELVEGETLMKRIEREGAVKGRQALDWLADIARALQHAHHKELVHRDIKPENIFITKDGYAKLGDFGLALDVADEATRITRTGIFMGSVHYSSPEQAEGLKDIDIRSDIYSLGATFYHAFTGQVPFEGTSAADVLVSHLTEELPWPGDVNPRVSDAASELIAKMMAKKREERFQAPMELLHALDELMSQRGGMRFLRSSAASSVARSKERRARVLTEQKERREKREKAVRPPVRIHPRVFLAAAGGAMLLAAAVAVIALGAREKKAPETEDGRIRLVTKKEPPPAPRRREAAVEPVKAPPSPAERPREVVPPAGIPPGARVQPPSPLAAHSAKLRAAPSNSRGAGEGRDEGLAVPHGAARRALKPDRRVAIPSAELTAGARVLYTESFDLGPGLWAYPTPAGVGERPQAVALEGAPGLALRLSQLTAHARFDLGAAAEFYPRKLHGNAPAFSFAYRTKGRVSEGRLQILVESPTGARAGASCALMPSPAWTRRTVAFQEFSPKLECTRLLDVKVYWRGPPDECACYIDDFVIYQPAVTALPPKAPAPGPAPSALAEKSYEIPPGFKKVVIFREGFESGGGDAFIGSMAYSKPPSVVADPQGKGKVLKLGRLDGNVYFEYGCERPPRLQVSPGTRVSFRYLSPVGHLKFHASMTDSDGKAEALAKFLPATRSWSRCEFALRELNPGRLVDKEKSVAMGHVHFFAGPPGVKDEVYLDDIQIYDLVPITPEELAAKAEKKSREEEEKRRKEEAEARAAFKKAVGPALKALKELDLAGAREAVSKELAPLRGTPSGEKLARLLADVDLAERAFRSLPGRFRRGGPLSVTWSQRTENIGTMDGKGVSIGRKVRGTRTTLAVPWRNVPSETFCQVLLRLADWKDSDYLVGAGLLSAAKGQKEAARRFLDSAAKKGRDVSHYDALTRRAAAPVKPPETAPAEKPEPGRWAKIFNGRDLEGWETDSPKGRVEEGALVSSGGACLFCRGEWEDFALQCRISGGDAPGAVLGIGLAAEDGGHSARIVAIFSSDGSCELASARGVLGRTRAGVFSIQQGADVSFVVRRGIVRLYCGDELVSSINLMTVPRGEGGVSFFSCGGNTARMRNVRVRALSR